MARFRWFPLAAFLVTVVAAPTVAQQFGAAAVVDAPNQRGVQACAPAPAGAEEVRVSSDGHSIHAWRFRPDGDARGTVLVLHGIRDDKRSMIGWVPAFAAQGYETVLVDLRGHGCSGGQWLSYGVRDGPDLSRLIDALGPVQRLGVYGPSYGGAAAIHLAAQDPRVDAIVTVATFSSLRDVVPDYVRLVVGRVANMIPSSFYNQVIERASVRGGVRLAAADSARRIEAVRAPVLLLHGDEDRRIPVRHARALNAVAARSELQIIPGHDHDSIMRSPEVRRATVDWLRTHM